MSLRWIYGHFNWLPLDERPIIGPIQIVPLNRRHGFSAQTVEELCAAYHGRLISRQEYQLAIYNNELTHPTGFPICVADRYQRKGGETRHGFFINPRHGSDLSTNIATERNWRLRLLTRGFRRPAGGSPSRRAPDQPAPTPSRPRRDAFPCGRYLSKRQKGAILIAIRGPLTPKRTTQFGPLTQW